LNGVEWLCYQLPLRAMVASMQLLMFVVADGVLIIMIVVDMVFVL
jgi:hypothetical protein